MTGLLNSMSTLWPAPGGINPDLSIIRPEFGGYGLLSDGTSPEAVDFMDNFSGGILRGFQYNPADGHSITPIQPSGVFGADDPNADGADSGSTKADGSGFFKAKDMAELEAAFRNANFGGYTPMSAFSAMKDMGGNTFDIDPKSRLFGELFYGYDSEGKMVPISQGVYGPNSGRAGQPLEKGTIMSILKGRLSTYDLSGGSDGGEEAGGDDNAPGDNDGGTESSGSGEGASGSGGVA